MVIAKIFRNINTVIILQILMSGLFSFLPRYIVNFIRFVIARSQQEVRRCEPHLAKQIQLYSFQLICCSTASRVLSGGFWHCARKETLLAAHSTQFLHLKSKSKNLKLTPLYELLAFALLICFDVVKLKLNERVAGEVSFSCAACEHEKETPLTGPAISE